MTFSGLRTITEKLGLLAQLFLIAAAAGACEDADTIPSDSLVTRAGHATKDSATPRSVARPIGRTRKPSAAVYVLDASTSSGEPQPRCKQTAVRLTRERSAMPPKEDLWVYVLALGDGQGAMHRKLVDWRRVAGERWSGDLVENPDAQRVRAQGEQRRAIEAIAEECATKIARGKGSPVLASIRRALELLAHQCGTEQHEGCSSQKIFVFSDLQDRTRYFSSGKQPVLAPGDVSIQMCGYAESADALDAEEQTRLLARWRDRLGPSLLPMAPTCLSEEGEPLEGSHG